MKSYKTNLIVEAFQWSGSETKEEEQDILKLATDSGSTIYTEKGQLTICAVKAGFPDRVTTATIGDWIVNINDRLNIIKPDIFTHTYKEIG